MSLIALHPPLPVPATPGTAMCMWKPHPHLLTTFSWATGAPEVHSWANPRALGGWGGGLEREAEWWAVRGTISHLDMHQSLLCGTEGK